MAGILVSSGDKGILSGKIKMKNHSKITLEKRAELFKLWCSKQSVSFCAKTGAVNRATVDKYRLVDKWDDRLTIIKEHAEAIADAKSEKRLAQNLIIIKFIKGNIVEAVKKGKVLGSVSDLIGAIRTEELILGRPDSRPAKTEDPEIDEAKLDEELIQLGAEAGIEIKLNHKNKKRFPSSLAGKNLSSDNGK